MKGLNTSSLCCLQGKIILASQTHVSSLEDKGGRKHLFFVRCGQSGKEYEISADDNRSRNEWLLAIKKVMIALCRTIRDTFVDCINVNNLFNFVPKYGQNTDIWRLIHHSGRKQMTMLYCYNRSPFE